MKTHHTPALILSLLLSLSCSTDPATSSTPTPLDAGTSENNTANNTTLDRDAGPDDASTGEGDASTGEGDTSDTSDTSDTDNASDTSDNASDTDDASADASQSTLTIEKPRGTFSASGSRNPTVVDHPEAQGALIRVEWDELEPTPGQLDLTRINSQLTLLRAAGKKWSLGVVAGPASPSWLYAAPYNVEPLNVAFRGATIAVPKFWDPALQERLRILAEALAAELGQDQDLALVYLPQMSGNGIEGHFNGNTPEALTSQGFTEDLWVQAVQQASQSFAEAFPTKPVAIELHYILGSVGAAQRIIQYIEADPARLEQLGVAIWWLSGRTSYQPDLLDAFSTFQGTIYAQLIAASSEPSRFGESDYTTAFTQARSLGITYMEPWEDEFISGDWDTLLHDFNTWAEVP